MVKRTDNQQPRVTVLIPNYNYARYLGKAVQSVLSQTFTQWQVVIGDDASTDNSLEVARAFADSRIEVVSNAHNVGHVPNMNLLLNHARNEFVAILHSDDWWEPEFLSELVTALDDCPSAIFATCSVTVVTEGKAKTIEGLYPRWGREGLCASTEALRILAQPNFIQYVGVLLRRNLFRAFPAFDESLPVTQDWLMWMRAATIGDVYVSPKVLGNYRRHDASVGSIGALNYKFGQDYLALNRLVQAEWAGSAEPFSGARELFKACVWGLMTAHAATAARAGAPLQAARILRHCSELAPSKRASALVLAARGALVLLRPGPRAVQMMEPAARRMVARLMGFRP